MTERSKVIDCKSIGNIPRRFESGPPQIFSDLKLHVKNNYFIYSCEEIDFNYFCPIIFYFTPIPFFFEKKLYENVSFTFNYRKLVLSCHTKKRKTFLLIYPGLFFWKLKLKKCMKKSLKLKSLQMRFFKKLLFLLKISVTNLYLIKKIKNYNFFFNLLIKPINHFFFDPIEKEEVIFKKTTFDLNIKYIFFVKQISFYLLKSKKKARLKRKISRKIYNLRLLEH